jgi:hypothetical protein
MDQLAVVKLLKSYQVPNTITLHINVLEFFYSEKFTKNEDTVFGYGNLYIKKS